MSHSALATAADYAQAMLTARRFKNWLVAILLVMLVTQEALFFTARFTDYIFPSAAAAGQSTPVLRGLPDVLRYATALINFLGIALSIVLAVVLALIVKIMLVGRLLGVARTISGFIWCLILVVMVFPWQAFLGAQFPVPGALYTWIELSQNARFSDTPLPQALLHWARFAAFPGLTLAVLIIVQARSSRGIKLALGESVPHGDEMRA